MRCLFRFSPARSGHAGPRLPLRYKKGLRVKEAYGRHNGGGQDRVMRKRSKSAISTISAISAGSAGSITILLM